MSKQTKPWINYGDVNFIEHGGCLVRETDYPECYEVIYLETNIYDYNGKYKVPMIVAKCFIDLSNWLMPDDKERIKFSQYMGYDEDYIPSSLEEKMCYCASLVNNWGYGFWEFDPDFPKETGCGCYSFGVPMETLIVGKTIVEKFLKEYGVPSRIIKNRGQNMTFVCEECGYTESFYFSEKELNMLKRKERGERFTIQYCLPKKPAWVRETFLRTSMGCICPECMKKRMEA